MSDNHYPIEFKYLGTAVTITAEAITHTSLGRQMASFPRNMVVGFKVRQITPPMFGKGGSWQVTIESATGEKIVIPTVKGTEAMEQLKQEFDTVVHPIGIAAAAPAPGATPQTLQATREYTGEKAMLKGIQEMQRQGWRVISQTAYQPGAGVGRVLALGVVGAAVFKPGTKFIVTFERTV